MSPWPETTPTPVPFGRNGRLEEVDVALDVDEPDRHRVTWLDRREDDVLDPPLLRRGVDPVPVEGGGPDDPFGDCQEMGRTTLWDRTSAWSRRPP